MHASMLNIAVAVTVVTLLVPSASAAVLSEAPKRKPGLWQQTLSTSGVGMPPQTMSMCTNEKTDSLLESQATGSARCTQQSIRRQGNSVVVEAVCKDGATTVRTHGVFTGDFMSRYTGELRPTFDPPRQGVKEVTQKIEARWIAPCKPGQKPGDVVLQGMGGMNLNEMMNADPQKMQEMIRQMQKMQQQAPR